MCIYIYIYIFVYVCIYIYTCIYIYIYMMDPSADNTVSAAASGPAPLLPGADSSFDASESHQHMIYVLSLVLINTP